MITYSGQYHGRANKPIAWKDFVKIFDTIWGGKLHNLPAFPAILGSFRSEWRDGRGATHTAGSLDEIGDAYRRKETYDISIEGNPNHTLDCSIYYLPYKAEVQVVVRATSQEKVVSTINTVRSIFTSELPQGYGMEGTTFWIILADGTKGVIDFEAGNTGNNDMYFLFSLLFDYHLKGKGKPVQIQTLTSELKKRGIPERDLQRPDYLKTTVGNIRKKIERKHLDKLVSIVNVRGTGYYLSILN